MTNRKPTHPGAILREDVFPALKLKASRAAEILDISRQYMSDILNGKKPMTPLLCLKIGKLAGNGPDLWMNMQARYNLWEAAHDKGNRKALAHVPSLKELETAQEGRAS